MATPKALSAAEDKDLRRVFATLAQFQRRARLEARAAQLREQRGRLDKQLRGAPEGAEEELEAELEAARRELAEVEREHEGLEAEQNRKIKAGDIVECLRTLGRSASRKEVEDMIWEVDENLDGMVDWDELCLTYQRNVADTSGLEPCQLFHLLQFLMYDKDGSGKVTVDETLHMLYARYGRDKLEGVRLDSRLGLCVPACRRSAQSARPLGPLAKARLMARALARPLICPLTHARSLAHTLTARRFCLAGAQQMKLLFGEDLATADGDGELTFSEYLAAVRSRHHKQAGLHVESAKPQQQQQHQQQRQQQQQIQPQAHNKRGRPRVAASP